MTPVVVIVNVPVNFPAVIVTLAGTVAARLSLESETTAPPDAAGPLRVIVPIEETLPRTELGLRVREATWTGLTVRFAV